MLEQRLLQTTLKLMVVPNKLTTGSNTNKKDQPRVPPHAVSHRSALVEAEREDFGSFAPNTVWRKHTKTQEAKLSLNIPKLLR